MKKMFLFIVVFLFSVLPSIFSGTNITGGEATGIWDLAGSPYLIGGDITVPAGETLTVEPGVVLEFLGWYKLVVNGALCALGTNDQRIIFTSTPPGPGEPGWVGIDIIDADDSTLLDYCIIENGQARAAAPNDRGGGIYILNSDPVIRNCTIRNNNTSDFGGAVYAENSEASIINSTITDNSTRSGGGGLYFLNSRPVLTGNVISRNRVTSTSGFSAAHAAGGGIYLSGSDAYIVNNIITGNLSNAEGNTGTTSRGGGIYLFQSDAVLIGNTVSGNDTAYYSFGGQGGGLFVYQSSPVSVNNIFWGNIPGEIYLYSASTFASAYNDVSGGQEGITVDDAGPVYWQEGNISSDPLFTSPADEDLTLQQGSPAINAGTAFFLWQEEVVVDLPSTAYVGPAPDLGALESPYLSSVNQGPLAVISGSPGIGVAPLPVQFSSNGSYDPDGNIVSFLWDFGDNTFSADPDPLHIFDTPGVYTAVLTITDDRGAVAEKSLEINVLEPYPDQLFIGGQQVTRIKVFGRIYRARDIVLITDRDGNPVQDVLVTVAYTGPNQGVIDGRTGSDGKVTFLSNFAWRPSGTWCFTVIDVSKDNFLFIPPQDGSDHACEGN